MMTFGHAIRANHGEAELSESPHSIQEILGLRVPPIAVGFLAAPPPGLPAWEGSLQPAGCSFWQLAQAGAAFYTVAADHFGCAVGAFTHSFELPEDRADQLAETVGLMVQNGYLQTDEVPGIPRLQHTPSVVAYAPADTPGFETDVVLLAATASQAMLIYEAALRCGAGSPLTNTLGRPSCAVLALAMQGRAALSLGCAGNRLYAGLRDDELYVAIPGTHWQAFQASVQEMAAANRKMEQYYLQHRAELQPSTEA
jgi:uncharacterized protein (DUF169 family)